MKIDFSRYSPQELRDQTEIEIHKCGDAKQAVYNALAFLNNMYGVKKKKKNYKYIRRMPDGKGGWKYFYNETELTDKSSDKIKLRMRFDAQKLFFDYNLIGFEERVGYESTSLKALTTSKSFEENIPSDNKEHVAVINEDGEILFIKTGEYDETEFNDDEIKKIRNAEIITHNHPEDKSFSAEDVFLALSLGVKEARVKTPNNTYFFKISHKQKSKTKNELKNKNSTFMSVLVNLNNEIIKYLRAKVKRGESNQKEAEKEHREFLWGIIENTLLLSEDFNIEYGKVKK